MTTNNAVLSDGDAGRVTGRIAQRVPLHAYAHGEVGSSPTATSPQAHVDGALQFGNIPSVGRRKEFLSNTNFLLSPSHLDLRNVVCQ